MQVGEEEKWLTAINLARVERQTGSDSQKAVP